MHILRLILVSKLSSLIFFIWTFTHSITFLHGIFVYIHTFFHCKIMCGCRLAICLYNIMHKSYEHRLDHSHAAPSVPISATFISTIGKIYLWAIRAVTLVLNRPVCLHNAAAIIYRNILLGENSFDLIRIRTWEKFMSIFSCRAIIYTVYYWKKCKKL